jgi:uncharacterized protein (TIRG00374 family)
MSDSIGGAASPAAALGRGAFWVGVGAVVSLAGFAVAAELAFGDALVQMARIGPRVLAGLLLLSLGNYLARGLRWQIYARRVGAAVGLGRTLLYYVAGFALTLTPGKLGEALRLWLLRRHHGLRYERTTPILVADRVSDAIALAAMAVLGAAIAFDGMLPFAAAAAVVLAAGVMLLAWPRPGLALVSAAHGRLRRWPRFFAKLRAALRTTARLAAPRALLPGTVVALLGWACEALAFHWVLHALGADIGLAQSAFIFAAAMLAGAAAMLPGGLGGTEISMVALLGLAGVGGGTAIAATAIIRATTLWFACLLGFAALPFALRPPRRRAALPRAAVAGAAR